MILAGHQPEYLPYIGFFYKVMRCDKFIFVDHIQYAKKTFQNRNRIRTAHGSKGWTLLTVPCITHGRFYQRICDVEIDNNLNWQENHWKCITLAYKKTPYFENYKGSFEEIYTQKWTRLAKLNETIINYISKELNINVEVFKSSNYNFVGKSTDLLIEMCKAIGVDTYLSGQGGRAYIEENKFKEANLKHEFCEFKHPIYQQRFKPFVPYMSIIDMLFNCGDKTAEIIKNAQEEGS